MTRKHIAYRSSRNTPDFRRRKLYPPPPYSGRLPLAEKRESVRCPAVYSDDITGVIADDDDGPVPIEGGGETRFRN